MNHLNTKKIFRNGNKLRELTISNKGFLFDTSTGCIYITNPVSMVIINALRNHKGEDEIIDLLKNEYEIDQITLEKDLFDFFNQLLCYGLVKDV